MTFEEKAEVVISQLRQDRDRLQQAFEDIRAEIEDIQINGQIDSHTAFVRTGEQVKNMVLEIIDRYEPNEAKI